MSILCIIRLFSRVQNEKSLLRSLFFVHVVFRKLASETGNIIIYAIKLRIWTSHKIICKKLFLFPTRPSYDLILNFCKSRLILSIILKHISLLTGSFQLTRHIDNTKHLDCTVQTFTAFFSLDLVRILGIQMGWKIYWILTCDAECSRRLNFHFSFWRYEIDSIHRCCCCI